MGRWCHPTGGHPQGDSPSPFNDLDMHYVYVIKSGIKKWVYIGSISDLKRRFEEHNAKKVKSTKSYVPFTLLYYEAYLMKVDALKREIELKTHSQQKEILFKKLHIN